MSVEYQELRIDRSAFSVVSLAEADNDRDYWLSRSPQERLRHIQFLRVINYGNAASARLQRVFEIAQRTTG